MKDQKNRAERIHIEFVSKHGCDILQELGEREDATISQKTITRGLNSKQDKTAIVTPIDAVTADNRSIIEVTGDVVISLVPYEQDGYAHSYEIVLNVGDTAYSVAFPESIKWVKDLEIEANTTYNIIIEDNVAMYVAIKR